jgi:hypothetical protein
MLFRADRFQRGLLDERGKRVELGQAAKLGPVLVRDLVHLLGHGGFHSKNDTQKSQYDGDQRA